MPPGKVKFKKKNQNLQSIYLFYSLPIHGIDVFPNIPRKQSNFSYPWQLLSVVFSGITECNHCKNLALQLVSSCSYNGRTLSWSWHTGNSAALGFVISQAAVCVGTHCYEQSCCFCLLNRKVLESFVLVAWMQRGEPNLQLSSDLKQEPSNLACSLAPPGQACSSYNGLAAW